MATRSQRKLEKKRRKEKKRNIRQKNRPETAASLAYQGNKYKTEELVETLCSAETGILQAFVMTDRQLTDHTVEAALVTMILQMRRGMFQPLDEEFVPSDTERGDQDLLPWCIRNNWWNLFQTDPQPGRDKLIGVLRTILGSIDVWKSPNSTSRGYLNYIEGFLGKIGVSVDVCSPDMETFVEPESDELLEIGRDWCFDGDEEAEIVFENMVEHMIRSGQGERVVNVCQRLIGEVGNSPVMGQLSDYSLRAQGALQIRMK